MLGAVALGPLVLLSKGVPEYEAGTEGLRLTLLRCVGTISRPPWPSDASTERRPRHRDAGRTVPRPARIRVRAALRREALTNAALVRASQDYRTDFLRGDPFEPPLEFAGDVAFSCLKGAEDGDGLVPASLQPEPAAQELTLSLPARRIRLDEEENV
jgi:hypothetical protein